ncbi:putative tRNA pseudouridine synthase Pus10 [Geranomyces variabilis]|uniref:tRNA pseudouridine(55) synthase n=1 Tax=Geranomyces variabilis TaxID=109894 RepID=A0AAD5TTG0_9FUNG|nr:putative tRNA pseudouridine synthase Pus10 [Geranomyces variabilis]
MEMTASLARSTALSLASRLLDRIPAAALAARNHYAVAAPTPIASVANLLLADSRCCPRCTLRFLGIRDKGVHADVRDISAAWAALPLLETGLSENEAQVPSKREEEANEPPAKRVKLADDNSIPATAENNNICGACLGLLQCDHRAIAKNAAELFAKENYVLAPDAQTFIMSVRLPAQLSIRQRIYMHLLHAKLDMPILQPIMHDGPPAEADPQVEVKEILRSLLADEFAAATGLSFDPQSPFMVAFQFEHYETERDYMFMTEIPTADFAIKTRRRQGKEVVEGASADKISRAVNKLAHADFEKAGMSPPPGIKHIPNVVKTEFTHSRIFTGGRYLKLQRHISNSPWIIDGKRLAEHSVEELVATHVDQLFRADSHKFYSSGREDADVLMLGRGRPYYLELINPRNTVVTQAEMAACQEEINAAAGGKVKALHMQRITREETKLLKDSAETKCKSYSTLVRLSKPVSVEQLVQISQLTDLEVAQRNPTRVPRRADLTRAKVIHTLHVYPERRTTPAPASSDAATNGDTDANADARTETGVEPDAVTDLVRVDLKTSAGTYVKEFMHGDGGRTVPSLKDLLEVESAVVETLDVLEVHLDWPEGVKLEDQEDGKE